MLRLSPSGRKLAMKNYAVYNVSTLKTQTTKLHVYAEYQKQI